MPASSFLIPDSHSLLIHVLIPPLHLTSPHRETRALARSCSLAPYLLLVPDTPVLLIHSVIALSHSTKLTPSAQASPSQAAALNFSNQAQNASRPPSLLLDLYVVSISVS